MSNNMNEKIARRLKGLRIENRLTQVDLAKMLRIDKSTIAKYETGDRMPDLAMLCRIADIFSVTLDYLTDREK